MNRARFFVRISLQYYSKSYNLYPSPLTKKLDLIGFSKLTLTAIEVVSRKCYHVYNLNYLGVQYEE